MDATLDRLPRGRATRVSAPTPRPGAPVAPTGSADRPARRTAPAAPARERPAPRSGASGWATGEQPVAADPPSPRRPVPPATRRPVPPASRRRTAPPSPERQRRAAHLERRGARHRLGQVLAATVPLTEVVVLVALLAFPGTPTGTLLPVAGLTALAAAAAAVALHLRHEAARSGGLDPALRHAAVAGVLATTLLSWLPIVAALVLVGL